MSSSQSSDDTWPPSSWSPTSLEGKKAFYIPASVDRHQTVLFANTLKLRPVKQLEQLDEADLIVVDNSIKATDEVYLNILPTAKARQIYILTAKDVEFADRVFDDYKKQLELFMGKVEQSIDIHVTEHNDPKGFSLVFGEETIRGVEDLEDWTEVLHHEILLRDPIVRSFIETPQHYNGKDLESLIVSNPSRIIGTRWKLEEVLNNYLAEAWESTNINAWKREWNENEFNELYKGSKNFKPVEAAYAALWRFFVDNKKDVEERLQKRSTVYRPDRPLNIPPEPKLAMVNWNQVAMCPNCEAQLETWQTLSLCPNCALTPSCEFRSDKNSEGELHDSGFLDGTYKEADDQQHAKLSTIICPNCGKKSTLRGDSNDLPPCTNCNFETWVAEPAFNSAIEISPHINSVIPMLASETGDAAADQDTTTTTMSDINDIELVTVIRVANRIVNTEMVTRRKIEKERLEAEQKANDRHWFVHKYNASAQCPTDIGSVEIAYQPEAATIERDHEWFNKSINQSSIKEIPYSDIQDKDVAHPLGRGGSGSVYSAKWKYKMVAIKEFHNEETFLHTMHIIYTLGPHPNIVRVLAVTRLANWLMRTLMRLVAHKVELFENFLLSPCRNPMTNRFEMVMELASKGSLKDFWKTNPKLPWSESISIALNLAKGLQQVHKKGVLHDNLSCSNLLIRGDNTLALTGFSKSRNEHTLGSCQPSAINSDIYSFGVVLWELSACRPAFENALNPRVWNNFLEGNREVTMADTPAEYRELYELCWSCTSSDWPDISDIVKKLNQLQERFHSGNRNENLQLTYAASIIRRPYHILKFIYQLAYRRISQTGLYVLAEIVRKIRNTVFSRFSKSSQVKRDSELDALEVLKKLRSLEPRVSEIPADDLKIEKYWYKRGKFADIHQGQWNGKQIAIKAHVTAPSSVIREVTILNLLAHHNIVKFEGISTEYPMYLPYIIMDFASCTLQEFIGGFDYVNIRQSQRIGMCIGIAEGLAYVHRMQILHCDLHSANILINPDQQPLQPLIADFGLSRKFFDQTHQSNFSETYPRIAYTAPELLHSYTKLLPFESSQDIYSLGIIIWEVLSGESPYDNQGRRPNPKISDPIYGYQPQLTTLYQQCTSDSPSKRPDIGAIVRELKEIDRKQKPETLKLLLKLDENILDLMHAFDQLSDVEAVNVKDLKNVSSTSVKNILEYAEKEGRTLVTTDMHFRFKQSSSGILCLWGYYRGKAFNRIEKTESKKIINNLFHAHFGEIAKLQDTAQTKLAILSECSESFGWALSCPSDDDELEKLLPEMELMPLVTEA